MKVFSPIKNAVLWFDAVVAYFGWIIVVLIVI